ncbi:MAG: DUF2939 domain-containing protein [Hyphomicrobiaceae bacterium]
MGLRILVSVSALLVAIVGAYTASPFYAAWSLREAILRGDTTTIARKVEWTTVRASLRRSIEEQADLVPIAVEAGRNVTPTLWQRVKRLFGASMLDRFIETYVTPEGLPRLVEVRQQVRRVGAAMRPAPPEPSDWRERLRDFANRLVRAEFVAFDTVTIEIRDRVDPSRHFVSVLRLVGFEWKLSELHIVTRNRDVVTRL